MAESEAARESRDGREDGEGIGGVKRRDRGPREERFSFSLSLSCLLVVNVRGGGGRVAGVPLLGGVGDRLFFSSHKTERRRKGGRKGQGQNKEKKPRGRGWSGIARWWLLVRGTCVWGFGGWPKGKKREREKKKDGFVCVFLSFFFFGALCGSSLPSH